MSNNTLQQLLSRDTRRVFILDDDPTGTQTVSDVEVILRPSMQAYRDFLATAERSVFVLTNSRALDPTHAVRLLSDIRREVEAACEEANTAPAFVLRGDSTLRGHVFAEVDVFADGDSVTLFVPAFPEGGRTTEGGVHYLQQGAGKVPVAQTEFAKDPIFGYRSERMIDWVAEVGGGRRGISIPLSAPYERGNRAVADALREAPAGAVIVPDAVTRQDLETIAAGLLAAEAAGRRVVVRSASTFAAVRAGLSGADAREIEDAPDGRVLIVCGSHTMAATRQLEQLMAHVSARPVIVPTSRVLDRGAALVVNELTRQVEAELDAHRLAILATERLRLAEHKGLDIGAQIMSALTGTVKAVADRCDIVISKGGITSAQVATDGLGAERARVRGQMEPGVARWDLGLPDGRSIPYIVIPGNVGHDRTMLDLLAAFVPGIDAAQ